MNVRKDEHLKATYLETVAVRFNAKCCDNAKQKCYLI